MFEPPFSHAEAPVTPFISPTNESVLSPYESRSHQSPTRYAYIDLTPVERGLFANLKHSDQSVTDTAAGL
jgi:hypothetical protein